MLRYETEINAGAGSGSSICSDAALLSQSYKFHKNCIKVIETVFGDTYASLMVVHINLHFQVAFNPIEAWSQFSIPILSPFTRRLLYGFRNPVLSFNIGLRLYVSCQFSDTVCHEPEPEDVNPFRMLGKLSSDIHQP